MISYEVLQDYFLDKNRDDYQRDNFDSFLSKIDFSFKTPAIHIAGTNGKGSTAAYIANIYKQAGYKVGLFTSPEIETINDMIQINGEPINNEIYYDFLTKNDKLIKKYNLSSFEIMTFVALSYFDNEKCDIAIIECGMGGEIDATNVFESILSIITSVSLEHTSYLGKSIAEIALNKAGIICQNSPVLIGNLREEALNVITRVCGETKSRIYTIEEANNVEFVNDGYAFGYGQLSDLYIPSLAEYSLIDARLAIDAVLILNDKFPVKEEDVKLGLKNSLTPNRLEKLCDNPTLLIDGGHNPEALNNLVESLEKILNDRKLNVVFCSFKDKNIERMLAAIGSIADDLTLTTFDHHRAREEMDYFLFLDEYKYENNCVKAITNYLISSPNDVTLVTGSFAFASYVKKLFKDGKLGNVQQK